MKNEDYIYQFEVIRDKEFPQLTKTTHLDHAASTVFPTSLVDAISNDWKENLYANPHSQSTSSLQTSYKINHIRRKLLDFFNTKLTDYDVIFCQNASHALKIVGESFPFQKNSEYKYLFQSHNSLLGIREYALKKGASFAAVTEEDIEKYEQSTAMIQQDVNEESEIHHLFGYSPECNFTGVKYPMEWINKVQNGEIFKTKGRWHVVLDAAKFVSTNKLDLSKFPADFVAVSFYKMFGLPSGLGALIVKKEAAKLLQKTYFAGGTVQASASDKNYHILRKGISEQFEDGTVAFLNIIALEHALNVPKILNFSMERISKHTYFLSHFLYEKLNSMKHFNGNKICEFYGKHHLNDISKQGSILALNFLRSNGEYIGYREVEKFAAIHNINLRTGCFCNPGACQFYLGLSAEKIKDNFDKGHVCWDDKDVIDGKPTGAVRISIGYASILKDVEVFLEFVNQFIVEKAPKPNLSVTSVSKKSKLTHLIIYPIKSCNGMSAKSWTISVNGPLYDREWTLVDEKGIALKQNNYPKMSRIEPFIDLKKGVLRVDAPSMPTLEIDLNYFPDKKDNQLKEMTICGINMKGLIYTDEKIINWFSEVIGFRCFLVRKDPEVDRFMRARIKNAKVKTNAKISFANEGQFLLITRASMDALNEKVKSNYPDDDQHLYINSDWLIERFRPNLVISGTDAKAFEEDLYSKFSIGKLLLSNAGGCNRCSMININKHSLVVEKEPLKTLSLMRREKSRILFGILCGQLEYEGDIELHAGDDVNILEIK